MSCPASIHLEMDATATPSSRATVTVDRVFLILSFLAASIAWPDDRVSDMGRPITSDIGRNSISDLPKMPRPAPDSVGSGRATGLHYHAPAPPKDTPSCLLTNELRGVAFPGRPCRSDAMARIGNLPRNILVFVLHAAPSGLHAMPVGGLGKRGVQGSAAGIIGRQKQLKYLHSVVGCTVMWPSPGEAEAGAPKWCIHNRGQGP